MAVDGSLAGKVALVTGGGRGIGAGIARELAGTGMRVAVSARSRDQTDEVAQDVDGLAVAGDVRNEEDVRRMVDETERALGPIDLLVANAGVAIWEREAWEVDAAEWWRVLETNVLGVHLCCRAVIPGMLERGGGRIVVTASGAAYLPGSTNTAYSASKAAVYRYAETLAAQLRDRIPVFAFSPGLVRTEMTDARFGDNAPWTPPELAPRLVRDLATGKADRLAGRYIHAEHDDLDDLLARIDEVERDDLNAIRLRR